MTYHIEEAAYNGHDIEISMIANTGTTIEDGVSVPTHTVSGRIDGVVEVSDTTTTFKTLATTLTDTMKALKAQIDGVSDLELDALMVSLGYTAQEDIPTNFLATPASSTSVAVAWDADPSVTDYKIYLNTVNDFATATIIETGALSPHTVTGLVTATHYYFWLVADRPGADPSEPAADDAITP